MAGQKPHQSHHCGMCGDKFGSKPELNLHVQTHADNDSAKVHCAVCKWAFPDTPALEAHQLINGHGSPQYSCKACDKRFFTPVGLKDHLKQSYECSTDPTDGAAPHTPAKSNSITCDRCNKTFESTQVYDQHRSFKVNGPCADHNHKTPPKARPEQQKQAMPEGPKAAGPVLSLLTEDQTVVGSDADTPTDLSDSCIWCPTCKNKYESQGRYNAHALWCSAKHASHGIAPEGLQVNMSAPAPVQRQTKYATRTDRRRAERHRANSRIRALKEQFASSVALNGTKHDIGMLSSAPHEKYATKADMRRAKKQRAKLRIRFMIEHLASSHAPNGTALNTSQVNTSSSTSQKKYPTKSAQKAAQKRRAKLRRSLQEQAAQPTAPKPQQMPLPTLSAPATALLPFPCDVAGCTRTYRSEAGLKVHKMDVHRIGATTSKETDPFAKDAWIASQRSGELLKSMGLLTRSPTGLSRSGSRAQNARPPIQTGRPHPLSRSEGPRNLVPAPIPAFGSPLQVPGPSNRAVPQSPIGNSPRQTPVPARPAVQQLPARAPPQQLTARPATQHLPVRNSPAQTPSPAPVVLQAGGAYEMQQAKYLQDKIMRLLIQSDIIIHHDGKFTACGLDWTRISMDKQPDMPGLFDAMCHLPKMLQGEYLPPPKCMVSEYNLYYPSADFESTPSRDPAKPRLDVVALACSKIVLGNGLQDIVKIAAVDVVTCEILMNHLVCTDPKAEVQDWRSTYTGFYSWKDMNHALQQGYKIFKGWHSARASLWEHIDKETIIVGHNLRADLDALRMVHGRAVDMAKVAEKAAKGPLSKVQAGLESMSRDFLDKKLSSDPKFGRDMLMNTFAAREMGLWIIKNREMFEKKMKQKSLEYQNLMLRKPTA
jgi:hypothetical protein